ncbi:hypothetical protein [Catenovulum sediminis]|uniref:hypothetical protein n=1 Tax=Catenovulum sediminis TaxID=1740262 RepID=UPI00117DB948|nr:hypothetical protein [Catenovulum sediminis]
MAKLLDKKEFMQRLHCGTTKFWQISKQDPNFPEPHVTIGTTKLWLDEQVDDYIVNGLKGKEIILKKAA